jgi:hypothetical protein
MLKQSFSKAKKILTISLAIFLVISLTAVSSNAQGNYAGGNYHTYYDSDQPGYTTTTDVPAYWEDGVPAFTDEPSGINTGDVDILYRHRSPGTPEGA